MRARVWLAGLHEGDVLEAALHLGPLAALGGVGTRQVVFERQMLQRQQEYGKARALPGLRQLLQQVRVGVAAVADRLQVLAELVDHEQQGASSARQRAISTRADGEGPVRLGSSDSASSRAPLSVAAARNPLLEGISP